ncbi:NARE ribosyltransferase, partial [Brachypteracias leptosomus]|nr:NARE ribosyltransferase [Brachypteracias leptosomus]
MEHLVLGLVLLVRAPAAGSSPCGQQDDITEMDMASNCFDDQYWGCSHMMEEELAELNRTEFARNRVYAEAWTSATREWQRRKDEIPQTLRPELAIALLAYTMECSLYRTFNRAVREAGRSLQEYLQNFHFKVLHFLLSEALRALREAGPQRCYNVYRGVQGIHFTAWRRQTVRFGQFASTSLKESNAEDFGKNTSFSVKTCYGVPISDFSFYPWEKEVLIPPFEVFEVSNVAHKDGRAFIELRSQSARSNYNCELVKGDAVPESSSSPSPGRSIRMDPPHLWVLLLAATALAAAAGP